MKTIAAIKIWPFPLPWMALLLFLAFLMSGWKAHAAPNPHIAYTNLGTYTTTHRLLFALSRSDGMSASVRYDVWKEGEPDNKQSLLLETLSGERVQGVIEVPVDGIYRWSLTTLPGNVALRSGKRIAVSTRHPVLRVESIKPGAIDEGMFEMTAKVKSAVEIADVQFQVCQAGRCGEWITDLKRGEGKTAEGQLLFSSDLKVDHLAGSFTVDIWTKDEVKAETHGRMSYYRRVAANAALSVSLEQSVAGKMSGSTKGSRIERHEQIVYRINLFNDRYFLDKASLRYPLPGGLRPDGPPKIIAGDAEITLNSSWNGDADDELFAAGTVLQPKSSVTIEVPVALKDIAQDSAPVQSIVYAGASNLIGTVDATHRFQVAHRLGKTGHRVEIVKSADADANAQPGQIVKYALKVNNHTLKTVRNLLIRDRAPDHTTLDGASCGNVPASECRILKLGDKAVEESRMTHAALCKGGEMKSDPQGQHVFWCLNGDLEPLAEHTVDYSVRIDDGTAAVP